MRGTTERFNVKIDPWVHKFASWATGRIGKLIVASKLKATLHGMKVGPVTITFRLTLDDLNKTSMDRLLAMGKTIATACNAEAARVTRTGGFIDIELALPQEYAQTPPAQWLASRSEGMNICVGVDATCLPVYINLADHGAVLWVGPSRSGKTQSLKSVLYSVIKGQDPHDPMAFVILSQKIKDWQPFEKIHGCLGVISDAEQAMQVAQWAADEVDGRARSAGRNAGRFVIVADDLLNLLSRAPKMGGPLGDIASMGAGLGIHLLIGTQDAGSNKTTGSSVVEANATARVLYRTATSTKAATSSGQAQSGLAELSGVKGDALVSVDGKMIRTATGYMVDTWLVSLGIASRTGYGVRPWEPETPALSDNHRNQLQLVDRHPGQNGADVGQNGGRNGQQPVVQPVVTSGGGPRAVAGKVAQPMWPIKPARPLTDAETVEVQRLREDEHLSLNKLQMLAYGYRDGRTRGYMLEALGLSGAAVASVEKEAVV